MRGVRGRFFCLTALALLAASPAPTQEDACPFYDGRRLFGDWRAMSQLLLATSYRKECGLDIAEDKAIIRHIHEARGCPAESEVGRYFSDILDAPLNSETEHPALSQIRLRDPQGYAHFCRMAGLLPWPEADPESLIGDMGALSDTQLRGRQIFWAHLDAMQDHITSVMRDLGSN